VVTDGERVAILAEVFSSDDIRLVEFREYADLALPLAFAIQHEIVPSTPRARELINDAVDILLELAGATESSPYATLEQLFGQQLGGAAQNSPITGTGEPVAQAPATLLSQNSTSGRPRLPVDLSIATNLSGGLREDDEASLLQFPQLLTAEPTGEDAHLRRWTRIWRSLPNSVSTWFKQYGVESVGELGQRLGFSAPDEHIMINDEPAQVVANIVRKAEEFGEPVALRGDSPLALVLTTTLSRLGLVWEEGLAPMGVDSEGTVVRAPARPVTLGRAPFANNFGTRVYQEFSVYRDDQGLERILWQLPALVSTRVVDSPSWSEQVIVAQFASLSLCAIDMFNPSTSELIQLSRSLSYPGLEPEEHPRPVVVYERQACLNTPLTEGAARRFGVTSSTGVPAMDAIHPVIARMGWLLPSLTEAQLSRHLPHLVNGLVALSTMIEDGYRNHNDSNDPSPFDAILGSDHYLGGGIAPGRSAQGRSRWLPVSLTGDLVIETIQTAAVANAFGSTPRFADLLERVALDGVGHSIVNSTNTFVFSVLFPQRRFVEAELYLRSTSLVDAGEQQSNALSNLGIALYEQKQFDKAEAEFQRALSHPSSVSADEASFYLALLSRKRGDEVSAAAFDARCAAAGGYTPWDSRG
jgi:hypothetical protein